MWVRRLASVILIRLCKLADLLRSIGLAISVISDRGFYGTWTFPPLNFLYFNISQGLAIFYGRNRPDYYLTEGIPLLVTTALPFTLYGIYQSLFARSSTTDRRGSMSVNRNLTMMICGVVVTLSLVAHKEVRFIYPLLPAIHIITAQPLYRFASCPRTLYRTMISILLVVNVVFSLYISLVHQRGVMDVMHFLRIRHEARLQLVDANATTTVGFLMPCHSTPWRSHLVHVSINAWALSCEPPLHVPIADRDLYEDEADLFYRTKVGWLRENLREGEGEGDSDDGRKSWPEHLVLFEQLRPSIEGEMRAKGYRECWRGFNSHWHDDARRMGDVLVWCRI